MYAWLMVLLSPGEGLFAIGGEYRNAPKTPTMKNLPNVH